MDSRFEDKGLTWDKGPKKRYKDPKQGLVFERFPYCFIRKTGVQIIKKDLK